ncbi:Arm DNA-binding domain-containing protein [Mariniflexile sp.]|uniref:Arm DNA-binding domain-containing protein n=1 Tax=Mariniflexile sp. TaxID=1979402 RepID=UPI004047A14E
MQSSKAINNEAPLYARITVNGKRIDISLKRKIPLQLWDSTKKKARGNSREARQINQYLAQVQTQLFQCYQDLKFKGELITAKLIKEIYLGEDENSKTLQNILEYHTSKTENTFASGTVRNFGVTISTNLGHYFLKTGHLIGHLHICTQMDTNEFKKKLKY